MIHYLRPVDVMVNVLPGRGTRGGNCNLSLHCEVNGIRRQTHHSSQIETTCSIRSVIGIVPGCCLHLRTRCSQILRRALLSVMSVMTCVRFGPVGSEKAHASGDIWNEGPHQDGYQCVPSRTRFRRKQASVLRARSHSITSVAYNLHIQINYERIGRIIQ